jgi:hypothetical protein
LLLPEINSASYNLRTMKTTKTSKKVRKKAVKPIPLFTSSHFKNLGKCLQETEEIKSLRLSIKHQEKLVRQKENMVGKFLNAIVGVLEKGSTIDGKLFIALKAIERNGGKVGNFKLTPLDELIAGYKKTKK